MRGARHGHGRLCRSSRIIPAYAGSTLLPLVPGLESRDHPRICGEHMLTQIGAILPSGSSPHMRGAPRRAFPGRAWPGIIPAYAGSTEYPGVSSFAVRDHPRICGEHSRRCAVRRHRRGSSPHMRGALAQLRVAHGLGRIIPAYAGSTCPRVLLQASRKDHPRICGEHLYRYEVIEGSQGSSPHMRGALEEMCRQKAQKGIIPAYAGMIPDLQSPPRIRIIPAYAGSTANKRDYKPLSPDHPRICGEHWLPARTWTMASGSSPHMRGAQGGRPADAPG